MDFLSKEKFSKSLGLKIGKPFFLATYHPVTLSEEFGESGIRALINVLNNMTNAVVIFTGVNADPGHERISNIIGEFCQNNPARTVYIPSLGQLRYLSAMNLADIVLGNSSSGVIEAPALGVPTINIGPRQDGRIKAKTVIDCGETVVEISDAIKRALKMGRLPLETHVNPSGGTDSASNKIINVLKSVKLDNLIVKKFHNIEGLA